MLRPEAKQKRGAAASKAVVVTRRQRCARYAFGRWIGARAR
jgi:hypothetical protein